MDRFAGMGWLGEDQIPVNVVCSGHFAGELHMQRPDNLDDLHPFDARRVALALENGETCEIRLIALQSHASHVDARFIPAA